MKKFAVTVQRVEYRSHTFEVEAESLEEAKDAAMEQASNHNFRDDNVMSADESVESVKEL